MIKFANEWGFDSHSLNLVDAFVHKSITKGSTNPGERLEFFGDSILSFIVTEILIKKLPSDTNEGQLSRIRNFIVKRQTLAQAAKRMELENIVIIGDYERKQNLHKSDKFLADIYEALLGAIYIDKGLEIAKKFVLKSLNQEIFIAINTEIQLDPKTALQERIQSLFAKTPVYELVKMTPIPSQVMSSDFYESNYNFFEVNVLLDDKILGTGFGKSKSDAEMNAASVALDKIQK